MDFDRNNKMIGEKPKRKPKSNKEDSKHKKRKEFDPGVQEEEDRKNDGEEEQNSIKGRIDVHTLNYFKRVEKLLKEDSFEDPESKELFLNNVLAQTGEDLRTCQLARHKLVSEIMESLLGLCTSKQFLGLLKSFLQDFLTLAKDRFGSHVVETAIKLIPTHMDSKVDEVKSEVEEIFCNIVTLTKANISELMRNTYACHILSSLLQVLGGISLAELVVRSRNSQLSRAKSFKNTSVKKKGAKHFGVLCERTKDAIPDNFKKMLHKIAKKVRSDDNFGELLCHKNASPVLQVLLLALKERDPKMCRSLCNIAIEKSRLLEWSKENESSSATSVPILFADSVGSHVMEKIFDVVSEDLFAILFTKCFQKNLLLFALHPLANYILQHMLVNIPTKDMASDAIEELIPFTEDILASGNMGVVLRMAETCRHHQCKQKELVKGLMKAVHLPPDKDKRSLFLKLMLTLSTYDVMLGGSEGEVVDSKKENEEAAGTLTNEMMNYHGACLAKVMARFENPKNLVKGLLRNKNELLFIMKHEYGSFVVEEFLMSGTVSKESKKKLFDKVKDNLVTLATDKFGSHTLDKLWMVGDEIDRKIIKVELDSNRSSLKGNFYGRKVLQNCGIESSQTSHKVTSNVDSRLHSEDAKHEGEKKKKRKKEHKTEPSTDNDIAGGKKAKMSVEDFIGKEFTACVISGDMDDSLLMSDAKFKINVDSQVGNEIDELFAKVKPKKKKKKIKDV